MSRQSLALDRALAPVRRALHGWPGLPEDQQRRILESAQDEVYDLPSSARQAGRTLLEPLQRHFAELAAQERAIELQRAWQPPPKVPLTVGALKALLAQYPDNTLVHALPEELAQAAARAMAMVPPRRIAPEGARTPVPVRPFGAFEDQHPGNLGKPKPGLSTSLDF